VVQKLAQLTSPSSLFRSTAIRSTTMETEIEAQPLEVQETSTEIADKSATSGGFGNFFKSKPIIWWIAFICYIEWALIHIFAGLSVAIDSGDDDVLSTLQSICSEAPKDVQNQAENVTLWSPMVARIFLQHGLNLFFVGVWALIIPFWYTYSFNTPLFRYAFYIALWPFCADWGYFIGIDTVEYGGAYAEAQTYIISIALLLTGICVKKIFPDNIKKPEQIITIILPICLILAGFINKILFVSGAKEKLGLPQSS